MVYILVFGIVIKEVIGVLLISIGESNYIYSNV